MLTCCVLLHSMCDLKATQMNVQCTLIQELIFYEFDLGYNAVKVTYKICCVKGEDAVDQSTEPSSGKPKTRDSTPSHRGKIREYKASWASHSPVWFVTITSAKTSGATKLYFTLLKY